MRRVAACLLSLAGILPAACAAPAPKLVPPPPPITATDEPGLTIVLTWDAPADLDLYVTDPTWETVYFANNPSRSGMRLAEDVRCGTIARDRPSREVARIATPIEGKYRIGVDFIEACSADLNEVTFRLGAALHGAVPMEKEASIQLERFLPRVIDFEFDGSDIGPQTKAETE